MQVIRHWLSQFLYLYFTSFYDYKYKINYLIKFININKFEI